MNIFIIIILLIILGLVIFLLKNKKPQLKFYKEIPNFYKEIPNFYKEKNILMFQNESNNIIKKNNISYCVKKNIDYFSYNLNTKVDKFIFINYLFNNYNYDYIIYLENNLKIIDFSKDIRYVIQQGGDNDLILSRDENDYKNINLDVIIFRNSDWTLYKIKQIYWELIDNKLTIDVLLHQLYTTHIQNKFKTKIVSKKIDIGFPYFLCGICVYNEHAFNSTKSSFIRKVSNHSTDDLELDIIDVYPWKNIPGFILIDKNLSNLPEDNNYINNKQKRNIPKYIFQTMETSLIINDMNKYSRNNLINLNPEYKYFYFDSLDCRKFIKENFEKNVYIAYDRLLPGAFKADLWRYCVIYKYGGVYCDSGIIPLKGFDSFIEDDLDFIIPKDLNTEDHSLWQGFFASKPKNKILLKTINLICDDVLNYVYTSKYTGSNKILSITGSGKIGAAFNLFFNKKYNTVFKPGIYQINNMKFKILNFTKSTQSTHPFIQDIKTLENVFINKYTDYYKTNRNSFFNLCGKQSYADMWYNKNIYKLPLNKLSFLEKYDVYDLSHSKIIACSMINNEMNVLKFKLKELWDTVDIFIVSEGNLSHSAVPKPFIITNRKEELKEFEKKLIINTYNFPVEISKIISEKDWTKEYYSRYHLYLECKNLNLNDNDIIVLSDLDEVINPEFLKNLKKNMPDEIVKIIPHWFNYGWDYYLGKWDDTIIVSTWKNFKYFVEKNKWIGKHINSYNTGITIPFNLKCNYGWHVSYFMDIEQIKNKLKIQQSIEGKHLLKYDNINEIINDIKEGKAINSSKKIIPFEAKFPINKHMLQNNP